MSRSVRIGSLACFLSLALLAACGDDEIKVDASPPAPDAATNTIDAAPSVADAAATDAPVATVDAFVADAEMLADADPSACHQMGFGAGAVSLQMVGSLPTMTGGTIPAGDYDAVEFQMITSTFTGTYRGTWSFDGTNTLQVIEQIALNGATPPEPTPRTMTYTAAGTTLTRVRTCGGAMTFMNEYSVRSEAGGTFLDVRQNNIMFTFKKRP